MHTVVIDLGTYSTKVGFAGEMEPSNTFYTITGTPKYKNLDMKVDDAQTTFVGSEVTGTLSLYKITYPIDDGRITDWESINAVINYIFYILRVDPAICDVLVTTHHEMTPENKQHFLKMMFDDFRINSIYMNIGAPLTMYSGGYSTGLVIDMGASSTMIVPISEGYVMTHAQVRYEIGGSHLDRYMSTLLMKRGHQLTTELQKNLMRILKERACFTSLDFKEDTIRAANYEKEYTMPDGQAITVSNERFQIPEIYFSPEMMGVELESLAKTIVDVVQSVDIDLRRNLLNNIFLVGGSSLFPQFPLRLNHEIELELARHGRQMQDVRLIASKNRNISSWIGGSILATLPEFQNSWMTKAQYYASR